MQEAIEELEQVLKKLNDVYYRTLPVIMSTKSYDHENGEPFDSVMKYKKDHYGYPNSIWGRVIGDYLEILRAHKTWGVPPFDYYSKDFRKMRLKVFLKYGEVCEKCGITPSDGISLTVDHIKPVSKYPERSMDIDNLQVLCWPCNQEKSNKHSTDYRKTN